MDDKLTLDRVSIDSWNISLLTGAVDRSGPAGLMDAAP